MSLFAFDVETLAFWAKVAIALGGLAIAGLTVAGLVLDERVGTRRDEQDAKYKHETNLALTDATARIEEAKAEASASNERSKAMETEVGKLRLETETQRERAAKAEKELLELRESLKPRSLAPVRDRFISLIRSGAKGPVEIMCPITDSEACEFANEIKRAMDAAGWTPTFGMA